MENFLIEVTEFNKNNPYGTEPEKCTMMDLPRKYWGITPEDIEMLEEGTELLFDNKKGSRRIEVLRIG